MLKRSKNKDRELLSSFGKQKDESFYFNLIEKYFRNKIPDKNTFHIISDRTCNDLDFDELFMFIDRTNSKVGQQFLYKKLRTISLNEPFKKETEEIIQNLTDKDNFRLTVQKQLRRLNSTDAFYICSLFQDELSTLPKWFYIIPFLSLFSAFSFILGFLNSIFFLFFIGIAIINLVVHYLNKKNVYEYSESFPQLLKLIDITKKLFTHDLLKRVNPQVDRTIKKLDVLKRKLRFFRLESRLENDFEAFLWSIFELIKIIFLIEPIMLMGAIKEFAKRRTSIEELFTFVGEIDCLMSIASLRAGLDKFCIPNITENKKRILATHLYHPLISDCIENNIDVNKKSILLTGSNMSGKTSFIRTIGINAITSYSLNTCFAESFSIPHLKIYSAIRINDDLMNDRSYYFEEVLIIKEMITAAMSEDSNLFLLDEIFKGTNTIERISAGKAVLSALAKKNNFVFVSTHDIELADLLKDEYDLFHFSENINKKSVDFDYKLKAGKLKNRNAIKILQINGYPNNIIDEALKIAVNMDKI